MKKPKVTDSKPQHTAASEAAGKPAPTATAGSEQGPATNPGDAGKGSLDLQAQIEDLSKRLSDASAEAAASRHRVDELIAQLAEANSERSKLAERLETAHRTLQQHGVQPVTATAAKVSDVKGPAIVVRTRQGREQARYRAGRTFTREEVAIPLSELSADQLEALRGDRELVVTDQPGQEA